MPKSSKKRRQKAADFSKARLKLGKGKQLPANAVDTSFKARSIALPTQSITVDKNSATYTTKRKLTFDDLVSHLKHYNATTRKDAIHGLRELLESHPTLIPELLTSIINACVRIMSDEDANVRKSLLSFFEWLLPQVPADELTPHSATILLFATSAQTHIFPEIRLDAVRFIDLLLESIPQIVVQGWEEPGNTNGKRVLDGYLGLLNAGSKFLEADDTETVQVTSTASVVLSPASKLIVLKSLSTFLRQAVSSSPLLSPYISSSTPTWYMASSFVTVAAYDAFDSIWQLETFSSSNNNRWRPEFDSNEKPFVVQFPQVPLFDNEAFTLQALSDLSPSDPNSSGTSDRSDALCLSNLSRTLHPILISTFLDCSPSVFSPNSKVPEIELQLIATVAELCQTLYNVFFQASIDNCRACEELMIILGYMSPYFPFHAGSAIRDLKTDQTVQDLNLAFCELASLSILSNCPKLLKGKARASNKKLTRQIQAATVLPIDRVNEYVAQLLQGDLVSSNGLSRLTPVGSYTALLPTIWSLINSPGSETSGNDVLLHVIDHAIRIPSSSAVKKATIEFIGRLILLRSERYYCGSFKLGCSHEIEAKFEEWIIQLPKTLWELGSKRLGTTEVILRFLLRLFQRKACRMEAVASLCSRLIPYFVVVHPTRGKLLGPFSELPDTLRKLVLDVVATILSSPNIQGQKLSFTLETVLKDEDRSYWTDIS